MLDRATVEARHMVQSINNAGCSLQADALGTPKGMSTLSGDHCPACIKCALATYHTAALKIPETGPGLWWAKAQKAFMMDLVRAENSCSSQLLAVASSMSMMTIATSARKRMDWGPQIRKPQEHTGNMIGLYLPWSYITRSFRFPLYLDSLCTTNWRFQRLGACWGVLVHGKPTVWYDSKPSFLEKTIYICWKVPDKALQKGF